jgi:hypothetical protein
MKTTALKNVYRRVGSPRVNAPKNGYLRANSSLEYVDLIIGDSIEGNNFWLKDAKEFYYWSGAFPKPEILLKLNINNEVTFDIINEAIKENYVEWRAIYENVRSIGSGFKYSNGKATQIRCITFSVFKKENNYETQISPIIRYKEYEILTDVVETGTKIKSYMSCDDDKPQAVLKTNPFQPGCSISGQESEDAGTLGFIAYKSENNKKTYFLVSCYHVLCSSELLNGIYEINDNPVRPQILIPAKRDLGTKTYGTVTKGKLDDELDAAIAEIDIQYFKEEILFLNYKPKGPRVFLNLDNNPLFKVGRTSGLTAGYILSLNENPTISYTNDEKEIYGLIKTTSFCCPGDSGAAVLDSNSNLVGLIIAGDENFSYILPIDIILNRLEIEI